MRKCNRKFAERFPSNADDRTNFRQTMAHSITNNQAFQYSANSMLMRLLIRVGIVPQRDTGKPA